MSTVPPPARTLFDSLCEDLDASALTALSREVREHAVVIRKAADRNGLLPVDLSDELEAKLLELLSACPSFTPRFREFVVGAARYFVSTDDHAKDTSGVLGLDDDVAVFNAVVRDIGRPDLEIDY